MEASNVLAKRLTAELLGTYVLVLGGCGSAVISAAYPGLGIGFTGVSLAFGLSAVAAVSAFGPVSGGHFNPAVSLGLAAAGRFGWKEVVPYIAAQVVGAIVACSTLYLIASGRPGFALEQGFAANGYAEHSPGNYKMYSALICEAALTFALMAVVLGSTSRRFLKPVAPFSIGFVLAVERDPCPFGLAAR